MGLRACRAFAAGERIAAARALLLPPEDHDLLLHTDAWPYAFAAPPLRDEPAFRGGALVFGDIAFCNHDVSPNARVEWVRDGERFAEVSLFAAAGIAEGAEITIRYTDADYYQARGVRLI